MKSFITWLALSSIAVGSLGLVGCSDEDRDTDRNYNRDNTEMRSNDYNRSNSMRSSDYGRMNSDRYQNSSGYSNPAEAGSSGTGSTGGGTSGGMTGGATGSGGTSR